MNAKEYYDWLQKFEARKTSDDTFTPPNVYDCVVDYVHSHVKNLDSFTIERPFYPGGDYQKAIESYTDKSVVIDNPPFSIISQIVKFYQQNNVKFFIFAPSLTAFSSIIAVQGVSVYACNQEVLYDNGAKVATSFLTNLTPHILAKTAIELKQAIQATQENKNKLPKYHYPPNVLMMSNLNKLTQAGVYFEIAPHECRVVCALDSQRELKKKMFVQGLLISHNKAKELQEKQVQEIKNTHVWQLSERELAIIDGLGA